MYMYPVERSRSSFAPGRGRLVATGSMGSNKRRRGLVGSSSRSRRVALMAFGLLVPLDAFSPSSPPRGGFLTTPSTFAPARSTETAAPCHHRRRRPVVFSAAETFVDATDTTKKTRMTTSAVGEEQQTHAKENTSNKINGDGGKPDAPFVGLPSYKRILTFVFFTFLM